MGCRGLSGLVPAVAILAIAPALAGAQGLAAPGQDVDLVRLTRDATSRAQAVAVAGGPGALSEEIARELSSVGKYEDFYLVGDFAPALQNFPVESVAAFRTVDMEIQYNLLLWSWRRFAFPAMAPVLKRLYLSPPEDYAKMRDLALRRLFELAPDDARPFLLGELQRNELRVSMVTLGLLPDAAFPEFESSWLRNLEHGILDERLDAAVRIERFGSSAVLADVQRLYAAHARAWSCEVRSAVLGYLVRVDALAAAPLVNEASSAPVGEAEDCRPTLMRSSALRMQVASRLAPPRVASTITAAGPVPGEERRLRFLLDEEACESIEELTARLMLLPAGTKLTWRYETGTSSVHPERWTRSERAAVLDRIQRSVAPRGIAIQP